ncbi:MAG: helix-turn-helix domain-containing protein [Chloroflexi bacterium]|nr:helix-turn-helix domain-containing protein [Chloroflexota bacterium]
MNEEFPLQEEFIIEDLEALKMISDPRRLQILRNLDETRTVKELAERLDIPATKLYYHVNQMEKHGLIRVVATRVVSGIIEKHYRVTAKRYHVSQSLLQATEDSDEQLEVLLSAIFDTAKAEVKQCIQAGLLHVPEAVRKPEENGIIWHGSMKLTPEKFTELNGRFQAILEEFDQPSPDDDTDDKDRYGLVVAFYPILHKKEASDE